MPKKIKLIATDMDGTLLDSKKNLPVDFYDWVKAHDKVKFVIASGRQYRSLDREFVPVHDKLIYIAENGALILKNDEVLHCDALSTEDVIYCFDLIDKLPCGKALASGVKSAYIENPNEHEWHVVSTFCGKIDRVDNINEAVKDDQIVKIAIYYKDKDAEAHLSDYDVLPERIKPVLSGDSWIDLSTSTVSKGAAMKVIQDKLNVSPSNCMAFGDYFNDVDLLEACGESYCMKNAHPDMFQYAKYVAPSNDESGVMQVLKSGNYDFG